MVFHQSSVVTQSFPGPSDFLAIIKYLKNFFHLPVRFCEMDFWLGLHLRPQLTENANQNNSSVSLDAKMLRVKITIFAKSEKYQL